MVEWRKLSGVGAVVGCAAAFSAGALGGCGPTQPATGPAITATAKPAVSGAPVASGGAVATSKPFDPCDGSPPLTTKYLGVLQDARCDDDKFPIMADVATMLGVDCRHCHVPHPTDPKKEMYPVMTSKKETANWMRMHLMKGIKPADGSELKCKSCHTDEKGKPIAKILGTPRDTTFAHEWMSLVMTKKFVVAATGEKLKCKHCHVGNIGTPEWHPKVISTDHIPAH